MSDPLASPRLPARVTGVLMTEESIYGLILVSGMIVVSNNLVGTSVNALVTVVATVAVFFCAHVFAGTLARLAATEGRAKVGIAVRAAAHHSRGMLLVSVVPLSILALGVTRLVDDEAAIWTALLVDAAILGILGWLVVARWSRSVWLRLSSALITAGFGVIMTMLKVLIHR